MRTRRTVRNMVLLLLLLAAVLAGCGKESPGESSAPATIPILPPVDQKETTEKAPEADPYEIPLVPNAGTPYSEEEADRRVKAAEQAARLAERMTEKELICQLLVLYPEAVSPEIEVLSAEGNLLYEYPLGGILLRAQNAETQEQVAAMVSGFKETAPWPPLILAEEEGGRKVTLMKQLAQPVISNMFSYRGDGLARAYLNAQQLSDNLAVLGLNADLAPVADVWSDLTNRNIGERAYADSYMKAAELVAEAVKGFRSRNMICTLKYFPGSGEAVPTEKKSPVAVLEKTETELRHGELIPYAAGIAAGADMVMVGNLMLPQLDADNLAPFSHRIVSVLLRGELGFDGVIVTDMIEPILSGQVLSPPLACLKALAAGCDLLLCPFSDEEALEGCVTVILAALEAGNISRERLEESVIRILTMKILHGFL